MNKCKNICFLLLLITICFWSDYVKAQQDIDKQAETLFKRGDKLFFLRNPTEKTDQQAISTYHAVIQLYEDNNLQGLLLAESYQRLGSIYLGSRKFGEAGDAYHQSLKIKEKLTDLEDSVFYKEFIFLGNLNALTDRPDSAEWYYTRAVEIAQRYPDIDDVERAYNSLGVFYRSIGDYRQSINFFEKALSVVRNDDPDFLKATISFTYNIAHAKRALNKFEESILSYHRLLDYGIISDRIYLELGLSYTETGKYDSADYYLQKARLSKSPEVMSTVYNSLGNLYIKKEDFDSAEFYFNSSQQVNAENFGFKNSFLARTYLGLAKVEMKRSKVGEALNYYQQALTNSSLDFDDTVISHNPQNLEQSISLLNLFSALEGKAGAFKKLFFSNRNQQHLQLSLDTYRQAIRVAQHIQKTYDNDEAKLFLVQNVYPVYEEAISTAHQLYRLNGERKYAELAFQFSEYSKAAVLSEMLDELDIKASGQVSDSLIQEEKRQKQQISRLRLQLIELQDSTKLSSLQQELNGYEISLAGTFKALQKDEKFYRLKYQQDSVDITQLQAHLLSKDDALLEYFLGQDSLYSFLLTQNSFLIKSQAIDTAFYNAITAIQAQLYDYQMGQPYEQSEQAFILYQKLIEPFAQEIKSKKRLIIVPDGQLNYIPFEMLNDDPAANHYLIFNHSFSYAYSASLLEEAVSTRKAKESNAILAMAPFAGDEEGNVRSNGFSLLFGSKEEVENIGGSIYLENEATKRLFLELVSSYGIIHLATHASISDDDPLQSFIAFYPNEGEASTGYRLYTQELYNLRLDSVKLVVLSACEAGNGQLVKGEGIISLARAFAYAGCPNIITTLWKAQDKSTAIIASDIHEYLKKGYSKDQALRQAKLDYLASEDIHPLLKTPYYWANFIFIGDTAPMYERSYGWLWWAIACLIIILGAFWLIKKTIFKS